MGYDPSTTLLHILRSTRALISYYGRDEHEPTLSELSQAVSRAITYLETATAADSLESIQAAGSGRWSRDGSAEDISRLD
jgi:hypothetical protein